MLLPEGAAYAPTVEAFGRNILDRDGRIDRKKLGATVFGSPEKLQLLTSFVHPAVFAKEEEALAVFAREQPDGIAIVEAAILIETGRYRRFNRLIVTFCTEEQQLARAMARDQLTEEQIRARIRAQMPLPEKRALADFVVDTSGTPDETIAQVHEVYRQLRSAL